MSDNYNHSHPWSYAHSAKSVRQILQQFDMFGILKYAKIFKFWHTNKTNMYCMFKILSQNPTFLNVYNFVPKYLFFVFLKFSI